MTYLDAARADSGQRASRNIGGRTGIHLPTPASPCPPEWNVLLHVASKKETSIRQNFIEKLDRATKIGTTGFRRNLSEQSSPTDRNRRAENFPPGTDRFSFLSIPSGGYPQPVTGVGTCFTTNSRIFREKRHNSGSWHKPEDRPDHFKSFALRHLKFTPLIANFPASSTSGRRER